MNELFNRILRGLAIALQFLCVISLYAQQEKYVSSISFLVGPTLVKADAEMNQGFNFDIEYSRKFTNSLNVGMSIGRTLLRGQSQTMTQNSQSSYQYNSTIAMTGISIGYGIEIPKAKMQIVPYLTSVLGRINSAGQFKDIEEAKSIYNNFGQTEFIIPEFNNGELISLTTEYERITSWFAPSLKIEYHFLPQVAVGLDLNYHLTYNDNLDGFSLPVWRNTRNDVLIPINFLVSWIY